MSDTQTYDELKQEAERRWNQNSQAYTTRLQDRQAQIANSPDVLNAPALGSTWSVPEIPCPCGQATFMVMRYACINGIKHRTELRCSVCARVGTWDFRESRWLN